MDKKTDTASRGGSTRTLGRTTAMFLTAAMIIGTGLFAALGETAERAGSGLLLAIVLSGLVALATGLSAASCGINYPEDGAGFTWSRKFDHPLLGFIAGCAYLGKGIVSTVVIALAFATYTAQMAEGLPPYFMHMIAGGAVLLVTAVNLFGIELNAKMLIITLAVQIVLLAVFVGFAVPQVQPANLTPVFGRGPTGILAGAAIFFWSWDGFMRMAIMASQVKEPRRTIPFAVIGGITFAALVFVAVAAATLGVLGVDGMRGGNTPNDTPLVAAGVKAIGRWGLWIVLATAWLDTFTEAWGDLLVVGRVAVAMGKEHELPAWVGVMHPRFRSPQHAIIAIGVLCTALAIFFDLRPVLAVANVFTLVWYIIVNCDALMLPKEERLIWPAISWLGIAGCTALFVSLPPLGIIAGAVTLTAVITVRWLVLRRKGRMLHN